MNLLTWQTHRADKRSSSTREFSCVANMNAAGAEGKLKQFTMPALKGAAMAGQIFQPVKYCTRSTA